MTTPFHPELVVMRSSELIERVRDGVERRAGVRMELEVRAWN